MLQILKKERAKKTLLVVIIIISSALTLVAQRWEIGGLIGGSNYLGDITKEPNINNTNLGVNLWGRYNISRHFSYRYYTIFMPKDSKLSFAFCPSTIAIHNYGNMFGQVLSTYLLF